ncbi:MAG: YdjY domain-containing protein [Planctomycetota bacterium]|nr:YdjY domain-containing protein [Planctomycetota bacterium]
MSPPLLAADITVDKRLKLTFVFMMASAACLPVRGEETDLAQDTIQKFFASRGLQVDLKKREVKVDASVCLKDGILEYVLCSPDSYEHESIFVTRSKPRYLHLALTMVGLRECPFNNPYFFLIAKSPKLLRSRVEIDVEFKVDDRVGRSSLSNLLVNRADKDAEAPNDWIFLGSTMIEEKGKKVYAADRDGAVVSIVPNAGAVVQFGKEAGNPYHGEDQGFELNPETAPKVGTNVKLIFKPAIASPAQGALKKK